MILFNSTDAIPIQTIYSVLRLKINVLKFFKNRIDSQTKQFEVKTFRTVDVVEQLM